MRTILKQQNEPVGPHSGPYTLRYPAFDAWVYGCPILRQRRRVGDGLAGG